MAGLYPFELADPTSGSEGGFPWGLVTALAVPIRNVGADDILQNIVYFLPWGGISYLFLGSPRWRIHTLVLLAVSVGATVSLAIELCQVFFFRHPSVFDVLANTLGAALGALLCTLRPIDGRYIAARFLARAQQSRVLWLLVILFGAVPLIVSVSNSPWFDFHNWNRNYTFQLANEASFDRPWLGTIYLAAIYDRALTPEEIARHYQLGASKEALEHRGKSGPIASYTFGEGRGTEVHDVSGFGPPLNLALYPSSHFRWLPDRNGIEILQPAILKSEGPARKLFDAFRTRSELSFEVWMMPASVKQNGPARIVSLSHDSAARNFTVSQAGADIDFRLRTAISGTNGKAVNLRTRNGFLAVNKFHLVATYKDGVERLYVDGCEHPDKVDLKKADIIVAFSINKNPVAQIAYSLFYFFPVSFFFSFVFSRRFGGFLTTSLLPAALAVGLLSMAEVFQAYIFSRAIDLSLLTYGVIAAITGTFGGRILAGGTRGQRRDSISLPS
jgi:glycopeptide antibiotics resistance protein